MNKKALKKLVEIGLTYSVDYVHILEKMEKILNGEQVDENKIKPEDYFD